MANCADCGKSFDRPANGISCCEECRDTGVPREKLALIEEIVEECKEEHSELAQRALSAVPDHRLRKTATREIRGGNGEYKSRVVHGVLKAFLRWLAEAQESAIVFSDPDGEEVTAPLEHSFDEEYLNRKYGRIKDGEEAFVELGENPHSTMLTLTGSNENSRGDPRLPGDHIVDLQESWNQVRRELQRTMDRAGFDRYDREDTPERWWEYATVLEPHDSGYIHMHVAVFTSHSVEASDFRGVMEKHVENCSMAGTDAHSNTACSEHRMLAEDEWNASESQCGECNTPVSVNGVDPESESMESVSNLGSYLAEYIGGASGGESLWEEPVSKLIAYSTLWATDRKRVRFSNGFNKLAEEGREMRGAEESGDGEGWDLVGVEDAKGDRYDPHDQQRCENCDVVVKNTCRGKCPDCGGELKSQAANYTREIRGIRGGDPPPVRT